VEIKPRFLSVVVDVNGHAQMPTIDTSGGKVTVGFYFTFGYVFPPF